MKANPDEIQKLIEKGVAEIETLANRSNPGLARAWQAINPGLTNRDLVTKLAPRVDYQYPPNRISEWRHNDRPIPPVVQHCMRQDILSYILSSRNAAKSLQKVTEPQSRGDARTK